MTVVQLLYIIFHESSRYFWRSVAETEDTDPVLGTDEISGGVLEGGFVHAMHLICIFCFYFLIPGFGLKNLSWFPRVENEVLLAHIPYNNLLESSRYLWRFVTETQDKTKIHCWKLMMISVGVS